MQASTHSGVFRQQPMGLFAPPLLAFLACAPVVYAAQDYPAWIIICVASLAFMAACYFRPIIGAFLCILICPIQSIYFGLSIGWPLTIKIYYFEILAFLILPVLVLKRLSEFGASPRVINTPEHLKFCWLYFASAVFIAWSMLTLLWALSPAPAAFGWWRLMSNFVLCSFLLVYMDSYRKLMQSVVFFCLVAVLFSFAALYSTYYGIYYLFQLSPSPWFSLYLEATLLNSGGIFDPKLVGLAPSFGLAAKHEMGVLLSCGTAFSIFLVKYYRSSALKVLFSLFIVLFTVVQYMAVVKASTLGLVLSFIFLCLAVAQWRKYVVAAIVGFVALIGLAAFISLFLKPVGLKDISTTYMVSLVANKSAFQAGSFANRMRLMGEAVDTIRQGRGLGQGPDSIELYIKNGSHGHDLFLTYLADYGLPGGLFAAAVLCIMGLFAWHNLLRRPRTRDLGWFLRCALFTAFLITLFEYILDCYIWYPQIWIIGALFLASIRIEMMKERAERAASQGIRQNA